MRILPLLLAALLANCLPATQVIPPQPAPSPPPRKTAPRPVVPVVAQPYTAADWPLPDDLQPADVTVTALDLSQLKRSSEPKWELSRLNPESPVPAVPGRAVGVLYTNNAKWGAYLGHRPEHIEATSMLTFSFDGSRGFSSYFGTGLNDKLAPTTIQVGRGGTDDSRRFHLAELSLDQRRALGMGRTAQLVEVEVNAGLGNAPLYANIVLTKGRVIDGTKRYPGKVDELLPMLRERFDEQVQRVRSAVDDATAAGRATVASQQPRVVWQPVDEAVGVRPSFHHRTGRLEVLFYWRQHIAALGPEYRHEATCRPEPCPPDGSCPPCDPGPHVARQRYSWAHHCAMRFSLTMDGKLLEETVYPLKPFNWGIRS